MAVDNAPPPEPKGRADFVKCKYLVYLPEICQLMTNTIQLPNKYYKNVLLLLLQTSAS